MPNEKVETEKLFATHHPKNNSKIVIERMKNGIQNNTVEITTVR